MFESNPNSMFTFYPFHLYYLCVEFAPFCRQLFVDALYVASSLGVFHLSGCFRGNDSPFSEVLDTLQTTFHCCFQINLNLSKYKKRHYYPTCSCPSCNTFPQERFFGGENNFDRAFLWMEQPFVKV